MPDIFMSSGSRASFQVMGCESYLLSRTPNGVIIFYNKLSPPSCCSRLADQRLNRNNWNRKFDSRQGEPNHVSEASSPDTVTTRLW